jgi:hypothetical protein
MREAFPFQGNNDQWQCKVKALALNGVPDLNNFNAFRTGPIAIS